MKPISQEPKKLGRVIARREYRIGRDRVVAELGTPQRASWKHDWYCVTRITYQGHKTVTRIFGIDAFQALLLSLQMLKIRLELLSPKIRWDAGQCPGDVGIEKMIRSHLGFEFARKMGERVDAAYRVESRRIEREDEKRARRWRHPRRPKTR